MSNWILREYTNPKELYKKIEDYFNHCKEETANNFANGVKMIKAPSISGMCIFLNISRQTFYNYLKKPEYANIQGVIQNAILQLEDFYVSMGFSGSKFAEFMLRNTFSEHYQEKQVVEHKDTQSMPSVEVSIDSDEPKALEFDCGDEVKNAE